MQRYYFDIRDGSKVAIDEEGLELPDLAAAKAEAAHSLGDIAKQLRPDGRAENWTIEVRQNGKIVFRAGLNLEPAKD